MLIPHKKLPVAGRDYQLNLPTGRLSFSQISLYLRCPQRYWQQYRAKQKFVPHAGMVESSILHKVFEYVFKHPDQIKTVDDIKALRDSFYVAQNMPVPAPTNEVLVLLSRFLTHYRHLFYPVHVEHPFTVDVMGVPVTGIIDLVEETVVTDLKFAKDIKSYRANDSLQLMMYSYATGIQTGAYLLFDKNNGDIEHKCVHMPKRSRLVVENIVSQVAKDISEGRFPLTSPEIQPQTCNRFCPVWSKCMGKAVK